jgi:AraC family transcriptional activator of pobA
MSKIESIQEFYKEKHEWMPDSLLNEIGHFNVFKLDPYVGSKARPVPYKRREYFKITLLVGNAEIHYADKVIEVQKQALVFSNPQIPYKWERIESIESGYFCVFNLDFFREYGNPNQYSVFQPTGTHLFELSDEQVSKMKGVFERMFEEIKSDYVHKSDILRTLVYELIHSALKMQPNVNTAKQQLNASGRISTLFMELLERQFPIDNTHQSLALRSASDFAQQLNVHVNHLNRAVKETTQKTTTQIIAERILRESKVLLKQSAWNVSEIAYALGFVEVTHFDNFFKKHMDLSPSKFRNT